MKSKKKKMEGETVQYSFQAGLDCFSYVYEADLVRSQSRARETEWMAVSLDLRPSPVLMGDD